MHKYTHPVFVGDAEGATALGISRNGFRQFVDKGILPPPKRLGKRKLWELTELVEAVRALRGSNAVNLESEPTLAVEAGSPNPDQAQSAVARRAA
jgi:hypothetical protein